VSVLDMALAERILCAHALALHLPNQRRAIVGHDDEYGRWEVSREHGHVIHVRPYVDPEWDSLDGDRQADYVDEEWNP
jgi:hypothetical protein